MRAPALLPPALLTCCGWLLAPVSSVHPECRFHLEIQEEETRCAELLSTQTEKHKACSGIWDNITCWRPADVGETVTVPCPKLFSNFYSKPGNISKNCTSDGWSETFPDFMDACGYSDPEDESKEAALHPELHPPEPVLVLHPAGRLGAGQGRRAVLQLWDAALPGPAILLGGLQAEPGLLPVLHHGQLLLAAGGGALPPHPARGHLRPWPALPGLPPDRMGHPHCLHGCVDCGSALAGGHGVNFILFVSIIRILLQKLTSPDVGGNDQSQYKRLAKSTLLLIPLFGVHYMVFAVFPIRISSKYQILFELCLGSFQGLVVAVLYCFLNSEVQSELRRTWRGLWPSRPSARDYRLHSSSISRTGSDGALQGPRGSRAPSLLQTETSVI
ncbi:vasoactive intestinal polypeptide receptor 2 isoform X2 [Bos indicus x Bos taurus]|uniref:vasoactive intestinal polypeptide receptor 2 isoform X2 n=1 Tax=Bos indicus x Bos taurus TaxID=30522 RepID=UPI000F7D2F30|nr:vasoactive intestinal polypeptide receptor 2 isoform X2 [Bos indicus x Bos taurus]